MAKRRAKPADTSDTHARVRGRQGQKHEPDWAPAFIEAFAEFGAVTAACGAAGISRQTAYERRKVDELFAAAWEDVEAMATERMEAEARRRAVDGWIEREEFEIDDDGELHPTLTVRKFSDALLMFLLKARRPDTYRERHLHEHQGDVEVNLNLVTDHDLREQAAALRRGLAAARSVKPGGPAAGD